MAIDFREQLSKQLGFLQTSCREYDAGNTNEAIRIAQALRVIFHNTRNSTSLLMHLRGNSISMHSTCRRTRTDNPMATGQGLSNFALTLSIFLFPAILCWIELLKLIAWFLLTLGGVEKLSFLVRVVQFAGTSWC